MALKWSAGPLVLVHLLRHAHQADAFHRVTVSSLLVAAPATAAYGIAQFIDPTPFDRLWMIDVRSLGLDSIGAPARFEVRVFATMNSPASLAIMLMVAIVVILARPLGQMIPLLVLTGFCLALTQVRAVWLATLVALLAMLGAAPLGGKLRILLAVLLVVTSSSGLVFVPEIEGVLSERFDTLTRLASDKSGEERLLEYERFFSRTEGLILGHGIAATGATRQLDGRAATVIDAGLIEPFIAFGIFGGAALLGALLVLVRSLFETPSRRVPSIHLYRAVVVGSLAVLPFGRALVGETGFGLWLFLGLGLASIVLERRRARLRAELHAETV